jgi:hypothetical protein
MANEINSDYLKDQQRKSFKYFLDLWNPKNGLVPDSDAIGAPSSIAGVGFGLSCYPVAVENKFITREEAARRTKICLDFFLTSHQGVSPACTGYKGFYYHFLDMKSGARTGESELSFIDSGLLFAGIICVAEYFTQSNSQETELRTLAFEILDRVDWKWALDVKTSLSQGWRPESGFINYEWEGYSEALLLYGLALGSDKYSISPECFAAWTSTYQWENIYNFDLLYAGPLFVHLFSQAWIDFRGIRDKFMCEKKSDYFENTRQAIKVQKTYCSLNPKSFVGYGKDCWGLTAGTGPENSAKSKSGAGVRFFGYAARGVPYGPDDGTIAPWASLACLPFDPSSTQAATEYFLLNYPQINGKYGLKCCFNASTAPEYFPDRFYAMDLGITIMMIENYHSELIWNLMKKSPLLRRGLKRAGFHGGWLKESKT